MKKKHLIGMICILYIFCGCQAKEAEEAPLGEFRAYAVMEEKRETLFCSDPNTVSEWFLHMIEEYQNDDIVGYVLIEGTNVDYPVVQAQNNSYYLHRNYRHIEDIAGSIFLDYKNDIARGDRQYILYGHNMNADIMFHSVRYYVDESYYMEHPYVIFDTLHHAYVFEVFTFYMADVNEHYYIHVNWPEDVAYKQYLDKVVGMSYYDTGVEVGVEDVILTLSTCTNISDDTRYVLSAKLISIDGKPVTEGAAATPRT